MAEIDHSSTLMRNSFDQFRQLYSECKYSDVILLVQNERFPVHRLILATHSDYFRILFHENTETIRIKAPLMAFDLVLKYFYSGKINLKQDIRDLIDVLELSVRFGLPKLTVDLVEYLVGCVSLEHLALFIKAGVICDCKKLLLKSMDILVKNCAEFFESPGFLELHEREISLVFSEELRLTNMGKFQSIAKWLKVHPKCSNAMKEQLLNTVNYKRLSFKQIMSTVRATQIFDDGQLLDMMNAREDVVEEVELRYNSLGQPVGNIPVLPVKVIVGRHPEHVTSDVDFTLGVGSYHHHEIVIDLGDFVTFNYLQFNAEEVYYLHVGVTCVTEYPTGKALRDLEWNEIKKFHSWPGLQTIYVPKTTTRFLRIFGPEKINGFRLLNLSVLPRLEAYWICPKENVCTVQNAVLEDKNRKKLSQAGLRWCDGVDRGEFTEGKFVEIHFNQSFFLRQFRFRLLDFDGCAVNSYDAVTGLTKAEEVQSIDGWLVIELEPKAYRRFSIHGSNAPIRLVHCEATGYPFVRARRNFRAK